MGTHGLANAPPDAIADHGFPESARHGKADMGTIGLRLADGKGREERTRILRAPIVNPAEILGTQQTDTFRKTRDGVLPFGTDSKFLAAARATA